MCLIDSDPERGNMKILTLKEIQNIELSILLEFKRVCEEYNLRFYLCGGTMLGAVRHNGFIPWDDDIDVMMPRSDYQKFTDIVKSYTPFSEDYKLFAPELGTACFPFAKLVYLKSFVEQEFIEDASLKHIWIDIMPVDGVPDNDKALEILYLKMDKLRKLLLLCWAKPWRGTSTKIILAKLVVAPFSKAIGAMRWCRWMNELALSCPYASSEYVGVVTWGLYGIKERCLRSEFESSIYVDFEGYSMPAIGCWNEYLTNLYGDYMLLPPLDKRKQHVLKAWID